MEELWRGGSRTSAHTEESINWVGMQQQQTKAGGKHSKQNCKLGWGAVVSIEQAIKASAGAGTGETLRPLFVKGTKTRCGAWWTFIQDYPSNTQSPSLYAIPKKKTYTTETWLKTAPNVYM